MKLTLKEKILQLNNFQSLDNFKLQKYLGKGSYGKVVSAFSEQLKETVAIKIIRKNKKKRNLQIDMEAYLLNKCESENIIKLHKVNLYLVLETHDFYFIIMEYVHGITLKKWIIQQQQLIQNDQARSIITQLLNALVHIHSLGITHRDIKPSNMMIIDNGHTLKLKLIDFGLGYQQSYSNQNVYCGTPFYMAPEVIQQQEYTSKVDVWSVGIIQYILLAKKHPFWRGNMTKQDYFDSLKSKQLEIQFSEVFSQTAIDFFNKTVAINQEKRMTSYQCLDHPWILGKESIQYPITSDEILVLYKQKQQFVKVMKILLFLESIRKYNKGKQNSNNQFQLNKCTHQCCSEQHYGSFYQNTKSMMGPNLNNHSQDNPEFSIEYQITRNTVPKGIMTKTTRFITQKNRTYTNGNTNNVSQNLSPSRQVAQSPNVFRIKQLKQTKSKFYNK